MDRYEFSESFAQGILALAARSSTFLRQHRAALNADFFFDPAHRIIAGVILSHFDAAGRPPTEAEIRERLRTEPRPGWLGEAVSSALSAVLSAPTPSEEYASSKVREFAADAAVTTLLAASGFRRTEAMPVDFETLGREIRRAAAVAVSEPPLVPYEEGLEARFADYATGKVKANPVPTGFPTLDACLDGGVDLGELAVMLGLYGTGKTQFLVNAGAAAVLAAFRVWYIPLEMGLASSKRRFDQKLAGKGARSIVAADAGGVIARVGNRLRIIPGTMYTMSVENIAARLDRATPEERPHLLIVDYGQLLTCEGDDPSRENRWGVVSRIYADLFSLAKDFNIAIWTAIQANRAGYGDEKGRLTGRFVAGAFDALQHARIVVSVNQTDTEAMEGVGRLWVEKANDSKAKVEIPVVIDHERSLIEEPPCPTT